MIGEVLQTALSSSMKELATLALLIRASKQQLYGIKITRLIMQKLFSRMVTKPWLRPILKMLLVLTEAKNLPPLDLNKCLALTWLAQFFLAQVEIHRTYYIITFSLVCLPCCYFPLYSVMTGKVCK